MNKTLLIWITTIILLSSLASAASLSDIADANIIAVYDFESDGSDSTSNGYDLTENNGDISYVSAVLSNGADLEADSSQYYNGSTGDVWSDFEFASDFSICFWYKPESLSGTDRLVTMDDVSDYSGGYSIYLGIDELRWGWNMGGSGDSWNNIDTLSTATQYHLCFVYDDSENSRIYYKNGVFDSNETSTSAIAWDSDSFQIGDAASTNQNADGIFDQLIVLNYRLDSDQVAELYNSGSGIAYPFDGSGASPNPVLSTPTNNTHTANSTIYFVINKTDGVDANCTYYINSTAVHSLTNDNSSTYSWENTTIAEGSYTWNVACDGSTTNSSTWNLIIDRTNPLYTEGLLATDNSTRYDRNSTDLNKLFTGYWEDTYMFGWNMSIFYSNGTSVFFNESTNLTGTTEWVNHTINMSAWSDDNFTVRHFGADDHTAKWIPDYAYNMTTQRLSYFTGTNYIWIENTQGNLKSITTEKLIDRYTFSFAPNNNRKTWNFLLHCDETLHYRGNLYNYPSFVCGKNWIDFNTENITSIAVTKENDNEYLITIERNKNNKEPIKFKSIGGLNINEYNYAFEIYTCNWDITNTSWSSWYDIGSCLGNNSILQNRTLTQYDSNYCANASYTNITYYESQYVDCGASNETLTEIGESGYDNIHIYGVNFTNPYTNSSIYFDEHIFTDLVIINETNMYFYNVSFWLNFYDANGDLTNDLPYTLNYSEPHSNILASEYFAQFKFYNPLTTIYDNHYLFNNYAPTGYTVRVLASVLNSGNYSWEYVPSSINYVQEYFNFTHNSSRGALHIFNITETQLFLSFVQGGAPYSTSGYVLYNTTYDGTTGTFTFNDSSYLLVQSKFGLGPVQFKFGLIQDTNHTQYYEYYNDYTQTITDTIDLFDDVTHLTGGWIQVIDDSGNALENALIRITHSYHDINDTETLMGQRLTNQNGKTYFIFDDRTDIKIAILKSGYQTAVYGLENVLDMHTYTYDDPLVLTALYTGNEYTGYLVHNLPYYYKNITNNIPMHLLSIGATQIIISTEYYNNKYLTNASTILTPNALGLSTFTLESGIHFPNSGSENISILYWVDGVAYNWTIQDWIYSDDYIAEKELFDLNDIGPINPAILCIALILFAFVAGILFGNNAGYTTFAVGSVIAVFFSTAMLWVAIPFIIALIILGLSKLWEDKS